MEKTTRTFVSLLLAALACASLVLAVSAGTQTPDTIWLPDIPSKPAPRSSTFRGCPPEGHGGDPILNRRKNRDDEAQLWFPVKFDAIAKLGWPKHAEKKPRFGIRASDRDEIAKHEGLPLSVEGYIARAQWEGKESCNCRSDEPEMRDMHLWLTKEPTRNRSESIVVEVTPRLRAQHPRWTISALKRIAEREQQVRISGWLMFDGEHPDQVGKTRGTLWEIHPVMKIQVFRDGEWTDLGGD